MSLKQENKSSRLERIISFPGAGYLFAASSFILALAVRFTVNDLLPPGFPFLTFFPAVILSGLVGGTRAGILCAILSTLAAWYWFILPEASFALDTQGCVAVGFFIGVCAVDLWIIHAMKRAILQLRAEKAYSETLLERQTALFQELQHRVANNLGFVSSLLALHESDVEMKEKGALKDARVRLETMSRVHRRLYDPANAKLPLREYLSDLCADILYATGSSHVEIVVDAPPVTFELEKLMNLSLIVTEAVTNAVKHAFSGGRAGAITVQLQRQGTSTYVLMIRDTGPGFPDGFDPAKSDRLGFRILQGFARSIQGDVSFANQNGGIIKVAFKA